VNVTYKGTLYVCACVCVCFVEKLQSPVGGGRA